MKVCRQPVALGRIHAGRIVVVHVSEHMRAIELDDDTRTVRRTATRPGACGGALARLDPVFVQQTSTRGRRISAGGRSRRPYL
jgi:hypothetical protein